MNQPRCAGQARLIRDHYEEESNEDARNQGKPEPEDGGQLPGKSEWRPVVVHYFGLFVSHERLLAKRQHSAIGRGEPSSFEGQSCVIPHRAGANTSRLQVASSLTTEQINEAERDGRTGSYGQSEPVRQIRRAASQSLLAVLNGMLCTDGSVLLGEHRGVRLRWRIGLGRDFDNVARHHGPMLARA